jgi:signal transduction histidine kinase
LYAEARRRNRELALLNRVIAASAASQEIETILEMVCRELARIFDLPQAAAGLLSEDRTEVIVVADYQRDDAPPMHPRAFPVAGIPAFKHMLEQRVPLVVDDALTSPQLEPIRDLVQSRGVASLLFLPLIVKEEVLGGMVLGATEPRPFPEQEVSLAQRVAEQVSGSLARARLEGERRRLEEQFRQRQKMEALGRLAGGVAHDFNNLLTVIHISTQLLQRQLHPQDPLAKHVREIRETGERAASLTRQLLSFSRREVISPRLLNLNKVVGDLSRMLQRVLGEDVHLTTVLADDLWTIQADPSQIDQVILNLAVNARDAMPGGGTLILKTANVVLDEAYAARHVEAQPGEYVRLSVSDSGTGMDDRVKARVFEPFFTTKERGQGSGLGLATVFGIVKQNGGHIEVHSQVGQGTTFEIYLPCTLEPTPETRRAADDLEPEMPSPKSDRRGAETILLVEDDAPIKDLATRVLESYGYRVLAAGDGLQALQIGERYDGPIHLLLTDVVLPQMSGKELAEQLRSVRSGMAVLYMSGYTDGVITRHGELAPGAAFVSKPFTIEELTQKVWQVLGNL